MVLKGEQHKPLRAAYEDDYRYSGRPENKEKQAKYEKEHKKIDAR